MRLYEIAYLQEPMASLRRAAEVPMNALAKRVEQSCNLGYRVGDQVMIIAEAESPSPFGFRVRVGSSFALVGTVSGELLLALDGDETEIAELADKSLANRLEKYRDQGFGDRNDALHAGVTDMAYPILRADGTAVGVLTIPYVSTSYSRVQPDEVRNALAETARHITRLVSGATAETSK